MKRGGAVFALLTGSTKAVEMSAKNATIKVGDKTVDLPMYDGTEGELYVQDDGPFQFINRWDDPDYRSVRDDLIADMYASFPAHREPRLTVEAPM